MGGKRFLFQSIDSGQTAEDCTSANAPIDDGGTARAMRACASSTSRTRRRRSSSTWSRRRAARTRTRSSRTATRRTSTSPRIRSAAASRRRPTRPGATSARARRRTRRSRSSRSARPAASSSSSLKEKPLSDDTAFNRGFQACHDIQFFMPKKTRRRLVRRRRPAVGHLRPGNPTMSNGEQAHAHPQPRRRPTASSSSTRASSAGTARRSRSWTRPAAAWRRTATARRSTDGFYYFYDVVEPGRPRPGAASAATRSRAPRARDLRVAQRERDPDQGPQADVARPTTRAASRSSTSPTRRTSARSPTPTSRTPTGKADAWSTVLVQRPHLRQRRPQPPRRVRQPRRRRVTRSRGALGR